MTKICAFVFARGGSKGLPRKNVLLINGIPLVAHSILQARQIRNVDLIFVSTDCQEIASIALDYGAEVIRRPLILAGDTSPELDSWKHAINYVHSNYGSFDVFLSLPTTAPLRRSVDIDSCLAAFGTNTDLVAAVTRSSRSPWFNMVTMDSLGQVSRVIDTSNHIRRQDAPICYDVTTVCYVSNPTYVLNTKSLWDGRFIGVEIPFERSLDVDSSYDFLIAKAILEQNILCADIL